MNNIIILILLLTVSCGVKVEVEDSKHQASGKVDVVIDWNIDEFEAAFTDACTSDPANDSQEKIDACIAKRISDFLALIGSSTPPSP